MTTADIMGYLESGINVMLSPDGEPVNLLEDGSVRNQRDQSVLPADTLRAALYATHAARLAALVGIAPVTSGTIKSELKVLTGASAAEDGINYHKLFCIGDETGTTAYGFGDPAKPTTGLMASFGRTAIATAGITDTAADFRAINKLVNTGANNLQGLYVKAKNYDTGTIGGDLVGAFVEVVNDGTVTGKTYGLKIGKDTGSIDADVVLSNGLHIVALTTAIVANTTETAAPAGSIGITSNATGRDKAFVSDGSKWQYAAVA